MLLKTCMTCITMKSQAPKWKKINKYNDHMSGLYDLCATFAVFYSLTIAFGWTFPLKHIWSKPNRAPWVTDPTNSCLYKGLPILLLHGTYYVLLTHFLFLSESSRKHSEVIVSPGGPLCLHRKWVIMLTVLTITGEPAVDGSRWAGEETAGALIDSSDCQ